MPRKPAEVAELLVEAANVGRRAFRESAGLLPTGRKAEQFEFDVAVDGAVVGWLRRAGFDCVSEESGPTRPSSGAPVTVVVDPVDGSENASRFMPWSAVSLAAMDAEGPVASVVAVLDGATFTAFRGDRARRDGVAIAPRQRSGRPMFAVSGMPVDAPVEWGTTCDIRALGCISVALCGVASGQFDGFVDFDETVHAPWDYLAAAHVCLTAGVAVADAHRRPLVTSRPDVRRSLVAGATEEILERLMHIRRRAVRRSTTRGGGRPVEVQGR